MKFRAVLWASVVLLAAIPTFAQRAVRTVTNQDLEKYKQKRLKAEKDYAENYERLGFPSPEELQKQIDKSRAEREALAARLNAERIAREQAEAEREAARQNLQNFYFMPTGGESSGYFFDSLGFPYRRGFPRFHHRGRGSRVGIPIRMFGAPTTPFRPPTSPFGSPVSGPRFRGRF